MYVANQFMIPEPEAIDYVQQISVGEFVRYSEAEGFDSTFLPFVPISHADGSLTLETHLARVNPQWRMSGPGMVIVNGPNAHISGLDLPPQPEGARIPRVPSWDYLTVHLTGTYVAHHDPEWKIRHLEQIVERFEEEWRLSASSEKLLRDILPALVGLEFKVTGIQGKAKLHQNLSSTDLAFTIENLRAKGGEPAEVAELMEKISVPWALAREARVAAADPRYPASGQLPIAPKE